MRNIKSKTNNNILPLNQNNHQSNIHNVNNHPIQDSTKKKVSVMNGPIGAQSFNKLPFVPNKISLKKEMEKEKIQKA